ncbi:hypothetical protein L3X38_029204 [Prunus dulcis]|uniref:NIF system FeS cluster assembly NifU N-terminal domain-containing protein n=1 Tax=Prunus dulcis TaxID=3755 RepID=A0AAD4VTY2_PRUDU|nr:hypothetical protein L3X38_029204 [Prunus dulcis]
MLRLAAKRLLQGGAARIKVDDSTGKIVDACFKTFGCGSAIASSSVATEWVKGKQMEEVLTIKNTEIAKHLSLPPVKLHCSMLAEDAIKAAVKDYQAKQTNRMAVQRQLLLRRLLMLDFSFMSNDDEKYLGPVFHLLVAY